MPSMDNSKFMKHKKTFVHYEFDYDIDRPECYNDLNMTQYERKITMKSLDIVQHPGDGEGQRKVYVWSGIVGGKGLDETVQCFKHSFENEALEGKHAT